MTTEQAKEILRKYPCSCQFGCSPYACGEHICEFGKAIRTLVDEPKMECHLPLL